jgi:hypothetical protein
VAYKAAHGDCNVPATYADDPPLGRWCDGQRQAKKRGTLAPERIAALEKLAFVWDVLDAFWDEMFGRLSAYKLVHGDCNVLDVYPADPPLGVWCHNQRSLARRGRLAAERIARLNALGFSWERFDALWNEMYQRLVAYRAGHDGDRLVRRRVCAHPVDHLLDPVALRGREPEARARQLEHARVGQLRHQRETEERDAGGERVRGRAREARARRGGEQVGERGDPQREPLARVQEVGPRKRERAARD